MNAIRHLVWGYERLLALYPADFRSEFGEEMTEVFTSLLRDVSHGGGLSVIMICLRELAELPKNLWREYANRLRRGGAMKSPPTLDPRQTASLGSIGFGLGFALLILLRAFIDPANRTVLSNFVPIWIRETLLFMLIGALGSALIGSGSRSARLIKRFTLAGILACGLAGNLGTLFLYLYYRFGLGGNVDRAPILNNLMVALVSSFIGALIGTALGMALNDRRRAARLAWAGALGFGGANLLSRSALGIASNFWMSTSFSELWFVPLVFSTSILGAVGGAVLGWALGWTVNPPPIKILEPGAK